MFAGFVAVPTRPRTTTFPSRLVSALQAASRLNRRVLQLRIPVTVALAVFSALTERVASWRNGVPFFRRMSSLRMGWLAGFAAVNALKTVVNLLLMALLAQVVTLAIAFVARFLFASRVAYRPQTVGRRRAPRNPVKEFTA